MRVCTNSPIALPQNITISIVSFKVKHYYNNNRLLMIPMTLVKVPVALPIRLTANKQNIYIYFMYIPIL